MLPQGHDRHQLFDMLPGADDAAAPDPGHAGHRDALA
jgi:hypothetical protein